MEIIKKNEIDKKGILVEYDAGYISPKDNRHFVNEMSNLTKGQPIIEEPLVVYAVLQKYGVENRNGRVYLLHLRTLHLNHIQNILHLLS